MVSVAVLASIATLARPVLDVAVFPHKCAEPNAETIMTVMMVWTASMVPVSTIDEDNTTDVVVTEDATVAATSSVIAVPTDVNSTTDEQ